MTYFATTLYINNLYQQQGPKIALGEGGSLFDQAISGITEYVSSKWKEGNLFGSIMGFMGSGILLKLSMPWMAVAYEVAGALGVDWAGLWKSLADSVVGIVKGTTGSKKLNQEEAHTKIAEATSEAFDTHTKDQVNIEALTDAAKKAGWGSLPKTSNKNKYHFIKQAGILSSALKSRGILSTLFKKIIPWVITRGLISLGLVVAVGAVAGVAGLKPRKKKEKSEEENINKDESESPDVKTRDPIHNYQLSPTVSPNLFEFNRNDASSIWLESGNIENIKSILESWISSAYPQLMQEKGKVTNSSAFIQVENMFRNRNKMAERLQIYSVPKPFQRKIDVVAYIINSYLKTRGN